MASVQTRHVPSTEFNPGVVVQGHVEHRGDERLPPSLAVPVIAGLSAALWAAIWYVGRGVMGL